MLGGRYKSPIEKEAHRIGKLVEKSISGAFVVGKGFITNPPFDLHEILKSEPTCIILEEDDITLDDLGWLSREVIVILKTRKGTFGGGISDFSAKLLDGKINASAIFLNTEGACATASIYVEGLVLRDSESAKPMSPFESQVDIGGSHCLWLDRDCRSYVILEETGLERLIDENSGETGHATDLVLLIPRGHYERAAECRREGERLEAEIIQAMPEYVWRRSEKNSGGYHITGHVGRTCGPSLIALVKNTPFDELQLCLLSGKRKMKIHVASAIPLILNALKRNADVQWSEEAPSWFVDVLSEKRSLKSLTGAGGGKTYEIELGEKRFLKTASVRSVRQSLYKEAKALAAIMHPLIPRLIESNAHQWKTKKDVFLLAECIQGQKLHSKMDIKKARETTEALVWILEHCHALGLIHRDIKPDNIILRDDNHQMPVLLDFGAVHNKNEHLLATDPKRNVGNRWFILPEHSGTADEKRDFRSDLTMMGGIFFYLLTGLNPRHLTDGCELPPHKRKTAEQRLKPLVVEYPLLNAFFDKCFQLQIENRYQKASEFLKGLYVACANDSNKNAADFIQQRVAEIKKARDIHIKRGDREISKLLNLLPRARKANAAQVT